MERRRRDEGHEQRPDAGPEARGAAGGAFRDGVSGGGRVPRWIAERRAQVVMGGVIGIMGLGGALMVPDRPARSGSAEVTSAVQDVLRERSASESVVSWDLPNLDHERVDYWVERFTTVPEMREKMEGFLHRSGIYIPMLVEKLEERGMPRDLIYLAMIESGFEPQAYSPANASGLWQFIGETGQRYGLEIDRAVDERNDPVKATDAALDYLEELYARFDSWYLAAAAYNTGENRVGRVMRETFGREQARSDSEYYRIWPDLPRETRDYVPLMIAAGRIAKEPVKHGFDHVRPAPALAYDEVVVPPATPLDRVASAAGVTLEQLRALNPHFRIERTPNDRDYAVRLPPGSLGRFAAAWGIEVGPEVTRAVVE